MNPHMQRVAAVFSSQRQGSGYLLGPRLVLTAAHVVKTRQTADVRVAGSASPVECDVVWLPKNDECDAALLCAREDIVPGPLTPLRWGELTSLEIQANCQAIGFPEAQRDEGNNLDSEQLAGSVLPGTGRLRGWYVLETRGVPPETGGDRSPWAGMSGAGLFCDDALIGVVVRAPRGWHNGRVEAVSMREIADESFCEALRRHGGPQTVLEALDGRRESAYRQGVVSSLAPTKLVGREAELAQLHRFCTGDGRSMWWRGDAWSGKTALLATLVMNPPPDTDLVAFFVNSRRPGHHDIQAFSRWTFEQLWALLNRQGSPPVGEHADPVLLPQLLREARTRVAGYGRRLVLVVDGLDEDLGPVMSWPRQRSIARLLAELAEDGTAVICAGRSTVSLPSDVNRSDMLWREGSAELQASPHVRELQVLAEAEVDQIVSIDGAPEQVRRSREVVAYIAAAGGGLTANDLEELVGCELAVVHTALQGVAGRVLASSTLDGTTTHFFAHELLYASALTKFGLALDRYRELIHTWADVYAQSAPAWPTATPAYLRFGYPELLISSQDLDRLTRLAGDPGRQRLLLETLGGDGASLTEVTAALGMHAATCDPESETEPDLVALFRLARRRDHLDGRASGLPVSLPAAWAALDDERRGRSLAASFVSDWHRTEAQRRLGEGFPVRSPRSHTRQDPVRQAVVDSGLLPRRDPPHDGLTGVFRITDPRDRLGAFAALSVAAAEQGRRAEAAEFACAAQSLLTETPRYQLSEALVDVLDAFRAAGDQQQVVAVARQWTMRVDFTCPESFDVFLPVILRAEPADTVLKCAHRAEDPAQDEESRWYRRRALRAVVRWALFTDQYAAAWDAASDIWFEFSTERALNAVADAVVRAGSTADDVQRLVAGASSPGWERIAASLIKAGRLGDAESIIRGRLTRPEERARALTDLAVAVGTSAPERGRKLLDEVHEVGGRSGLSDEVQYRVRALVALGERSRAEAVTRAIIPSSQRSDLLAEVAVSWAEAGDAEEAERVALTIHPPEVRACAFGSMAVRSPQLVSRWYAAALRSAKELSTPDSFAVRTQLARAAISAREFGAVDSILRRTKRKDAPNFSTLLQILAEPLVAAGAEHVLEPWFESDLFVAYDPVHCLAAAAKGAASRHDLAAATAYADRAADIWHEKLQANAFVLAQFDLIDDSFVSEMSDSELEEARCALAEALTAAGDLAGAEELLASSTSAIGTDAALTELACGYLTAGQSAQALAIVESADPDERPAMLAVLARRAASLGRMGMGRRMAGRALLHGKAIAALEAIARVAPDVARDLIDDI
ncbi:trypsin-like peptidase domain-containing protein [Streptomyces sp. NPDC086549]|uniref:trypsin-like peptidase domain-containing protein n=1 Tax=Streptomyces sp. NPDC086549 TaxID=3365752 RepID=UPI0038120FB3